MGLLVHDTRRTAVRNLVRAGVPEKTALTLSGHKTRAIFDRYDIVDAPDLKDRVQKARRLRQGAGEGGAAPGASAHRLRVLGGCHPGSDALRAAELGGPMCW